MMKKGHVIQALCCILLCGWYLMSVVGFDIHTDHHDDCTYVVSLLSDLSCEKIHPEDECACGHCGHDGCDDCDDCEDESDCLKITGTAGSSHLSLCALAVAVCEVNVPEHIVAPAVSAPVERPFRSPPRVLLNSLCVLRV